MYPFQIVDAHKFLSGDILSKLKKAQKAFETDTSFDTEVEALRKILPLNVTIADIDIAVGASWIPTKYYQQFVKEVFDVDASFYYSSISGNWEINTINWGSDANTVTYGYSYVVERKNGKQDTKTIPAVGTKIEDGLFTMSMHFKVPQVSDRIARREAALKQQQLQRLWVDWCKEGERGLELEKIYNHKFNRLVLPNWDDSAPANFSDVLIESGMSKEWVDRLRPYQLDSIWRMAVNGNSLLGLEVGLGKSICAIAVAMLRKFYKTSTKAMIVVQKSTLLDFYDTFKEAYPNANVLCATPEDCAGINRQKFLAKAAFWNYDAIIITHETFKAIPTRIETERSFIEEKLAIIECDLQALYAQGETSERVGKKRGNRIVKRLEEMRDKIESHLDELKACHDVGIHFEDLGISLLAIDECQRFKNNHFSTKIQAKGINLSASARSQDFDLKLAYMRKSFPGNNFLMLITGTPEPTNSLVGVYVFQCYLQPEELEKRGLSHFDAWASTFGRIVSKLEPSVSGELVVSQRFAEFVNIPELLQMYLKACHIKRFDDVAGQSGFTRPTHKVKPVISPLSEFQKEKMEWIAKRRKRIIDDTPLVFPSRDKAGFLLDEDGNWLLHPDTNQPIFSEKEAAALGLEWGVKFDNHLWLTTDARKLMVAAQLIDPDQPIGTLNKICQAVRRIYKWWRRTKEQRSTQLVFLDMGTPGGSAKFEIYQWMRQQLIERGIPKEEIAFIQDHSKGKAKKELSRKVNAGEVRVVIGSTEPMGIGVNMQRKIKVVHFIDIPRRPDEYEQRLGRAVRSGNENGTVLVYQYLTQGKGGNFGADAAQMHLLQTKLRSREQVLRGDPSVRRVVEEDDQLLLFMMLSAHASGDIRFMRYMEVKTELEMEESRSNLLIREINQLNIGSSDISLPVIKANIKFVSNQLDLGQNDVELAKSHVGNPYFVCKVDETIYNEQENDKAVKLADAHIHQLIKANLEKVSLDLESSDRDFLSSFPILLGKYGGMEIIGRFHVGKKGESVELWLKGEGNYDFAYRISEQRLIRNLRERYVQIAESDRRLQDRLRIYQEQLEESTQQLAVKRCDRESVNQKITELKQEKAYLEEALSINAQDLD
jgi:hypothetical protein